MTVASDYAANYATSQIPLGAPTPFVGPNGRAEVTPSGNLKLTPTTGGNIVIPAAGVQPLISWLTANFT